jgi:predicted lipoprotein with Yx(FWY)xxD motif
MPRIRSSLAVLIITIAGVASISAIAMAGSGKSATTAGSHPTLTLHKTKYGNVIFDGHDRALYAFGRDRGHASTCYGSCAQTWPPLVTNSRPQAASGARSGLIGTTRRKDGRLQVTYGGHPLYYYSADAKGQAKCQGVNNAGGIWLVISRAGIPVR